MSDPATGLEATAKIGPGRLVLVVGPSGAGKDTLIALAQTALATEQDVVFVRRVVTREASPHENNEQVSPQAFRVAQARGDFAIAWDAHGLSYALPRIIDDDIRAGRCVVANVSRTVISALRAAYADTVVVAITAPPDVLAVRLAMRGRASDGPVSDRLSRSVDGSVADVTINNVGAVEDHAAELVRAFRRQ